MVRAHGRTAILAVFVATISSTAVSRAGDALRVVPAEVILRGPDAVQQLAVEGQDARDLTATADYISSDPKVATVDESGLIAVVGDGTAEITVRVGGDSAKVLVAVR